MAEPSQTASAVVAATVSATAISAMSPLLSQYILIVIGGFFGSMFALNSMSPYRIQGVWKVLIFVVRAEGAAIIFSTLGSTLLAAHIGVQIDILWMPVSGVIAMYAHRIHELSSIWIKDVGDAIVASIKARFGGKP